MPSAGRKERANRPAVRHPLLTRKSLNTTRTPRLLASGLSIPAPSGSRRGVCGSVSGYSGATAPDSHGLPLGVRCDRKKVGPGGPRGQPGSHREIPEREKGPDGLPLGCDRGDRSVAPPGRCGAAALLPPSCEPGCCGAAALLPPSHATRRLKDCHVRVAESSRCDAFHRKGIASAQPQLGASLLPVLRRIYQRPLAAASYVARSAR